MVALFRVWYGISWRVNFEMKSASPILRALARLYAESRAGRTGAGQRDFLVDFKKLLSAAGCEDGDDRETAIRQLRELHGKLLRLEGPRRETQADT